MSPDAAPENTEKNALFANCAAPGAATDPRIAPADPDLQVILDRWATLPDGLKAGILAMIGAAK